MESAEWVENEETTMTREKETTATVYKAKVSGIAWAGYKASTEYTFDSKPTREGVMAKAGDFQAVTRISLSSETTIVRKESL
jgi:hypothetical protein